MTSLVLGRGDCSHGPIAPGVGAVVVPLTTPVPASNGTWAIAEMMSFSGRSPHTFRRTPERAGGCIAFAGCSRNPCFPSTRLLGTGPVRSTLGTLRRGERFLPGLLTIRLLHLELCLLPGVRPRSALGPGRRESAPPPSVRAEKIDGLAGLAASCFSSPGLAGSAATVGAGPVVHGSGGLRGRGIVRLRLGAETRHQGREISGEIPGLGSSSDPWDRTSDPASGSFSRG